MQRRSFLAAVAGVGLIGTAAAQVPPRPPLRLVYGEYFPPFNWVDEHGVMRGILIDLFDEALQRRLRVPLTHEGFPWPRAQAMVQTGAADAICTVPTMERRAYALASAEPVVSPTFTLFTRRNHPQLDRLRRVRTLADLHGFTVAHYRGSSWARQTLSGVDVEWSNSLDKVLRMVAVGRADATIDSSEAIRYAINDLRLQDELMELPQVLESQSFHLCIRRDSPDVGLLARFDVVMRQMRVEGAVARAYRKFGVSAAG